MKTNVLCFTMVLLLHLMSRANDTTIVIQRKINPGRENAGLKLPSGFSATLLADSVGRARHIVVTKQGAMYIKLNKLVNGKGILYAKDTDGNGKFDDIKGFGNYIGTGITIKDGYLYSSSNEEVFRYRLNENEEVINPDARGLSKRSGHFTIIKKRKG